ncbi:hypothetical protein [Catenovulum agarivorans]|uniref:hypothetical protein n=1 Tax=Catenovulum agarivorans TaxID=1172192 RepID=UPI0002DB32B5|nr:hypothetical protein [Catenovulum agarivorans]
MRLFKLVITSCFLLLSACANTAQFEFNAPADDNRNLYTLGTGDNEKLAIEDALANLSLRLSSDVSSQVHTLLQQSRNNFAVHDSSVFFQQSSQIARPFTFNNYQVIKTNKLAEQIQVTVSVAKQPFFSSLHREATQRLTELEQVQSLAKQQNNLAHLAVSQFQLKQMQSKLFKDIALLKAFAYSNSLYQDYQALLQNAINASAGFSYQFVVPNELKYLFAQNNLYQNAVGFIGQQPLTIFVSGEVILGQYQQKTAEKLQLAINLLVTSSEQPQNLNQLNLQAIANDRSERQQQLISAFSEKMWL